MSGFVRVYGIAPAGGTTSVVFSTYSYPINLSTDVTGVLPIANGGTGVSTVALFASTLGLSSMAYQASSNVGITGGYATGLTNVSSTTISTATIYATDVIGATRVSTASVSSASVYAPTQVSTASLIAGTVRAATNVSSATVSTATAYATHVSTATVSSESVYAVMQVSSAAVIGTTVRAGTNASSATVSTATVYATDVIGATRVSTATVSTAAVYSGTLAATTNVSSVTVSTATVYATDVIGSTRVSTASVSTASVYAATFVSTASVSTGIINLGGGQIAFPASQNAAVDANTLDDYEELFGASALTDASGAALTFTNQSTNYIKLGRLVIVTFRVVYPNTADGSAAVLGNLPFTSQNIAVAGGMLVNYSDHTVFMTGYIAGAATTMAFYTASGAAVTNANLSLKDIRATIVYLANA